DALWKSLRDQLSRYAGCLSPGNRTSPKAIMTFQLDEIDPQEREALGQIQLLIAQGLLLRLRRCENQWCQQWFYARAGNRYSCSRKCWNEHIQSKPEWKKKHNATRMRNYYLNKQKRQGE